MTCTYCHDYECKADHEGGVINTYPLPPGDCHLEVMYLPRYILQVDCWTAVSSNSQLIVRKRERATGIPAV